MAAPSTLCTLRPTAKDSLQRNQVPCQHDPTGKVICNTLEEQSELCFETLRLALAAAGAQFKHIVKITVFLRDMSTERVKAFRAIRAKHFGDHKPAATIVGAPALVDDALQVEIEAVAVLP